MGSFLKRKTIAVTLLAGILMTSLPVHAVTESIHQATPVLDDGYPTYPPTKALSPEQNKLIRRGEYLTKMGDCIACHTNVTNGTPAFSGGLPIATPFGTFYSPNITPDKETGIGKWTEADFIQAMKHGRDPQGRNYFPVFPYVYFANISEDDLRAMFAYFMSIPPVVQENKPLPFPFSVPGARYSLFGWDLLFFYPNTLFQNDSSQSAEWNRGKYLVDGLGHCSMCHTPLNPLGAVKNKNYLTGGFIDGYWAPNITKYGLESASDAEVGDVFLKNELINHAGPVAGPMAEVNHNSMKYVSEADRQAIVTYLRTVVSEEPNGLPPSSEPPTSSRGKQVYLSACILCHQNGEMTAPRMGNGSNWSMRLKASGLDGLYRRAINGYNSMPVKGACVTCSNNDIIAAVDYILDHSLTRSQRLDLDASKVQPSQASGQDIYKARCSVCHDTGRSGAPKIGDKKAWKPLISKNIDVLVERTIKGSHHPANGGCKDCTTREILAAIKYMVSQSKTEGNYSLW